jgi:hypothetical protein
VVEISLRLTVAFGTARSSMGRDYMRVPSMRCWEYRHLVQVQSRRGRNACWYMYYMETEKPGPYGMPILARVSIYYLDADIYVQPSISHTVDDAANPRCQLLLQCVRRPTNRSPIQ